MYGDRVLLFEPATWGGEPSLYSNREYTVYETMANRMEDHYGELRADRAVNLRLYVDTTNGVVVYDVAEYEKSLGLEPEERDW